MFQRLTRRIENLEKKQAERERARFLALCNCRHFGEVTSFHTAADLASIMAVRCPVHGFRTLGALWYRPRWLPLLKDREHCSCPPDPWRDFVEGKREKPTSEELMEKHNAEFRSKSEEQRKREFDEEHKKLGKLFAAYERGLRIRNGQPVPADENPSGTDALALEVDGAATPASTQAVGTQGPTADSESAVASANAASQGELSNLAQEPPEEGNLTESEAAHSSVNRGPAQTKRVLTEEDANRLNEELVRTAQQIRRPDDDSKILGMPRDRGVRPVYATLKRGRAGNYRVQEF